jgi:hypothetical protein
MLFSNACRFFFFSALSLAVNAETIRGTQRSLVSYNDEEGEVLLGDAENYVILTKTGISTVPTSAITGDIGVSPIAATAMTGFSFTKDSGGRFSTSDQLVGQAFASDYGTPIPSDLSTAVSNMEAAYTAASGRVKGVGDRLNLGTGTLGGVGFGDTTAPLTPGVYTFGTGVTIGADIYFDGSDSEGVDRPDAVFIIQMTGDLFQVADTSVFLSGGAQAKNIFWQLSGKVTVDERAHMEGILLVQTAVLFVTGSSLNGRVLAQTACDLQMATITQP